MDRSAQLSTQYQSLPSVDELLRTETAVRISTEKGRRLATALARQTIEKLRREISDGSITPNGLPVEELKAERLGLAERRFFLMAAQAETGKVKRVINATGVVIHTNLGRAPLSENARQAIIEAARYATVEYDLTTGKRGKRGAGVESLICELTGAEAALVVNNCAAAAFLVLSAFASGGEAIVSRGELVEIGGDFRIPDVLAQSGSVMREVGTTNRTKLADYEKAIAPATKMIVKVHPSNFRVVGFTSMPELADLAHLTKEKGILLYEDAGSGALIDLKPLGLNNEPVIGDSIAAGVDLVTFSGDKLLGGPQAGIIAGRKELIETIRKHPLYRALRVDKLIYAALEATLLSYVHEKAIEEIPVLKMLSLTKNEIATRASSFVKQLEGINGLTYELIDGHSAVGGGASPDFQPETVLIALTCEKLTAEQLEYALRDNDPPVITRITEGKVLIDLRTVTEKEENELIGTISSIFLSKIFHKLD